MANLSTSPRSRGEADVEHLREALDRAAHLLPTQAPIRVFVHHNTLHAFQGMPFDRAVIMAAERFGTEPYEREEAFALHLASGRIRPEDIDAVLEEEGVDDERRIVGGVTRRTLYAARLRHPFEAVEGSALRWLLEESDLLDDPSDADLFRLLETHAPPRPKPMRGPRPRDRALQATGLDTDELVHPFLIRFCAAFVDQGVAYWSMPGRERGLLNAFRALYLRPAAPPDPWLKGLRGALRRQVNEGWNAERTAVEMLRALEVPQERWDAVVERTLRALPGWAGMIHQLEVRPDRAPVQAPPARLDEYLAVYLTLEAQAVAHLRDATHERDGAPCADAEAAPAWTPLENDRSLAYQAFITAKRAGLDRSAFASAADARAWMREIAAFGDFERRRLWHASYERHHRVGVLDAMITHTRLGGAPTEPPRVQAFFCIDEREESLRRHLEEVMSGVETFGYAGFYNVPMAYRGLTDVKPTPLCPVAIRPRHLVVEEAVEDDTAIATRRRALGSVGHASHVGSRTFVRGGVLSATVGAAAVVPLIARCLFPRAAEQLSHHAHRLVVGEPGTRLRVEREEGVGPGDDGLLPGFTVAEMIDLVHDALRTMGLDHGFAPLVLVVGHGSSSLNNPHEAAHDCGATGGGRGGPNARAFAVMANHPEVRRGLRDRSVDVPEGTWFVGAYHNTCDDSMAYYDVDLVPEGARPALDEVVEAMETARRLDAHERCRRFDSAPLSIAPERALAHVERRAVDLGEPRPEYGHATNALCIVGRRALTRGLFLDRRAFLVSYDPTRDPDGAILGPLLASVGPVGAGISLEYYFSFVDPSGYGSGTKLPHNIVGLVGVMDGHASDLRTGLPWQMVEIHEPVRLLTIVEAETHVLERIVERYEGVAEIVLGQWIQLVAWSPSTGAASVLGPDGFRPYAIERERLPIVSTSADHYRGKRGHLECARIEASLTPRQAT